MPTTPNRGYPYPAQSDPADVPYSMQQLAEAVDADVEAIPQVGLVPIRPTSVSGAGVTIDSDGSVVLTGATITDINGIFSARYSNYKMQGKFQGSNTGAALHMRFRSATGEDQTGNYIWEGISTNGTGGNGRFASGGTNGFDLTRLHADGTRRASVDMEIFDPFPSTYNTNISHRGGSVDSNGYLSIHVNGAFNLPTSFQGVRFYQSAGTVTGRVRFFGYAGLV